MEIIKRKSGLKYREMLWINGRANKSPLFSRKTDCIQWKAEQLSNKNKYQIYGELRVKEKISLSDYSQIWLQSKLAQGIAKTTHKNYESNLRIHILPFFKNTTLQMIQKTEIENFQVQLKKYHNGTGVNIIVGTLKSVLRDAVKDNYLIKNPAEYIKVLSVDKIHDSFWTKSEIDQFLRGNFNNELYDLFLVAMNTGMRKGELAGLCWDRINFMDNTISITRTRDRDELKERTKTNVIRVIPINSLVKTTLLKLFNCRTDSNYVFLDKNQQPVKPHHLYRQFNQAQKKAGLKRQIRFHDLRHTFASQYIINGGSIYDLQKFLGHTNITMTTRYAHHSMDYLQNAINGFSLGESKSEEVKNPTVSVLHSVSKTEVNHILTTKII